MIQDYSLRGHPHAGTNDSQTPHSIVMPTLLRDARDNAGQLALPSRDKHASFVLDKGAYAGQRVKLRPLGHEFIDRMVELQKSDKSGNTIFRDAKFLGAMLDRGDKAFGVVTKSGDLLAMAVVRSDMELLPDTLRDKFQNAADRHAYVGSIVVLPECKGNKLMDVVLRACLNEAMRKGNTDVHARVVVGNDKCQSKFSDKFNFATIMQGQSPDAPAPREVYFMHRKLEKNN